MSEVDQNMSEENVLEGAASEEGRSTCSCAQNEAVGLSTSFSKREEPVYELTRPVFFIGFMGAGKTSVARKLARMCGVGSVDMDTYLERREGKKVKDIFEESGEDAFRAIETEVLCELMGKDPLLISCGGGVVTRPENREMLEQGGFVVFLYVDVEEAASRISDKSSRPLFQDLEAARQRNEERLPYYQAAANITVDTSGKGVSAIAREVRYLLKREGVLCLRQK